LRIKKIRSNNGT
jgi:hypothetical protein